MNLPESVCEMIERNPILLLQLSASTLEDTLWSIEQITKTN